MPKTDVAEVEEDYSEADLFFVSADEAVAERGVQDIDDQLLEYLTELSAAHPVKGPKFYLDEGTDGSAKAVKDRAKALRNHARLVGRKIVIGRGLDSGRSTWRLGAPIASLETVE